MRLALRRALGALGAAAGVLPLLPVARGLAARLAGPARLPGGTLASGDVKAATFAEAAVLVLLVPAAAFLFGRVVPDWIRRRGGYAVALPGLAMASSFLLWRYDLSPRRSVLAGLAAALAVAILSVLGPKLLGRSSVPLPAAADDGVPRPGPDERPRGTGLGVALALFVLFAASVRMFWHPHGSVDLFEQGHMLLPAQSYLAGGAPYRDTYPVHGWGSDGGLDGVLFRLFSPTLDLMRARNALGSALGVAMLGLACWVLFRRPLWSLAAFLMAMSLCPFPSERQTAAFAGLAALIHAARSGGPRAWALAGAVSAGTLFYALDFGVFLLASGLLTALCLAASEGSWRRAVTAVWLGLGAALASLPFVWALLRDGALPEFVRVSFVELPARILDLWGLPAPSPVALLHAGGARALGDALLSGASVPWLFHATVLAAASALLLFRSAGPGLSTLDRGAAAATWVAIVSLRGVLGRADPGHLMLYGVFAALPAAWLLYRAAHAAHAPWLWAPALAIVLVLRIQPQRYPVIAWASLRSAGASPDCRAAIPRSGDATIPCAQREEFEALRRVMDRELAPEQTFFDYGNEPALYFLLDRRPPVRYCCVPFYEGEAAQREVIAALERERPPLAILASGTFLDGLDGVSNRERTPLVAEYLDRTYEPAGRVGTRTIGRRRPDR